MIRFLVRIDDAWVQPAWGIILQSGGLSYILSDGQRGFASNWRLAESTINNPEFKKACWLGLSCDEREAALLRKVQNEAQGIHRRPLLVA